MNVCVVPDDGQVFPPHAQCSGDSLRPLPFLLKTIQLCYLLIWTFCTQLERHIFQLNTPTLRPSAAPIQYLCASNWGRNILMDCWTRTLIPISARWMYRITQPYWLAMNATRLNRLNISSLFKCHHEHNLFNVTIFTWIQKVIFKKLKEIYIYITCNRRCELDVWSYMTATWEQAYRMASLSWSKRLKTGRDLLIPKVQFRVWIHTSVLSIII